MLKSSLSSSHFLWLCSVLSQHMHRRSAYLELVGRSSDLFRAAMLKFSIPCMICSTMVESKIFSAIRLLIFRSSSQSWSQFWRTFLFISKPLLPFCKSSHTIPHIMSSLCDPAFLVSSSNRILRSYRSRKSIAFRNMSTLSSIRIVWSHVDNLQKRFSNSMKTSSTFKPFSGVSTQSSNPLCIYLSSCLVLVLFLLLSCVPFLSTSLGHDSLNRNKHRLHRQRLFSSVFT